MGMALSRDGRQLYATTRGGNEVVVIDTATDAVLERIPVAGEPARLLFTEGDARLLVSLIASGEVAVLDPRSRREVSRFKVGKAPEGLALDEANGFGFVSAQNDARVVKFALGDFHRVLDITTAEQPDPLIVLDEVKP
jgi:YVTN family beta-propeller protein